MNYELAKELKEAGFSQEDIDYGRSFYEEGEDTKNPTLSELIDACGWRFACVGKSVGEGKNDWYACAGGLYSESPEELKYDLLKNGSTPEEAVARLWLALNKK